MTHDHVDDAAEARRRAAHAALQSEAVQHWTRADELLGEADAALGRIANFTDEEDQAAVVHEAWADAHTADAQAPEHTADAGVLRAQAARLYSTTAPGGPTTVRAAKPRPHPAARTAPAPAPSRRAGR